MSDPVLTEFDPSDFFHPKTLRILMQKGAISEEMDTSDIEFLRRLSLIWGCMDILRPQITRIPHARRKSLLLTADLKKPWERWVFMRWYNHYLEYDPENSKPLTVKEVMKTVVDYHGVSNTYPVKGRIISLRDRARKKATYDKKR